MITRTVYVTVGVRTYMQKKNITHFYGIETQLFVIKHLVINRSLFDDQVNQLKRLSVVLISFSYSLILFEEKLRLCNHIIGCCTRFLIDIGKRNSWVYIHKLNHKKAVVTLNYEKGFYWHNSVKVADFFFHFDYGLTLMKTVILGSRGKSLSLAIWKESLCQLIGNTWR